MAFYYGIDSNSVSTLFSSLGKSDSTTSMLADYSSIRNGSYGKLLKAYYGQKSTSNTDKTTSSSKNTTDKTLSTSTAKDSTKTLSTIEKSSEALKESADTLLKTGAKSIFKKNSSGEYDKDKIYDTVKQFVSDYNDILDATETTKTKNIASQATSLITTSQSYAKSFEDIGISIEKDGTMSIDKDKFMSADMTSVKSLFNGTGTYGYQVSAKASLIDYYAESEASKANTYTSSGSYASNYSMGDIMNQLY